MNIEWEEDSLPEPSETQKRSGATFDRIFGNSVSAGLVTYLATATGSPESAAAIGGMLGPLAEELSFAIRRAVHVQRARSQHMMSAASAQARVSLDELVNRLVEDPSKLELMLRALEAAAHSTTDAKLNLIADLLSTGALAQDATVVDEQLLALDAISNLETPHFRLMLVLGDVSPVWWDSQSDREEFRYSWPEQRILQRDPGLRNGLGALVAKLQSLGLARDVGSVRGKEIMWELTDFGKLCIEALRDRASSVSRSGSSGVEMGRDE